MSFVKEISQVSECLMTKVLTHLLLPAGHGKGYYKGRIRICLLSTVTNGFYSFTQFMSLLSHHTSSRFWEQAVETVLNIF